MFAMQCQDQDGVGCKRTSHIGIHFAALQIPLVKTPYEMILNQNRVQPINKLRKPNPTLCKRPTLKLRFWRPNPTLCKRPTLKLKFWISP